MSGLDDLMQPALIWFVVGLVFLVAELVAPGLVIMFFGLAAWVVAAICLIKPISINTQLVIFILVTPVILFGLRNRFKALFSGHSSAIQSPERDIDDFVGKTAIVKQEIAAGKTGKVEFNGTLWSAESTTEIPVGETVHIVSRDNLILKVKKT